MLTSSLSLLEAIGLVNMGREDDAKMAQRWRASQQKMDLEWGFSHCIKLDVAIEDVHVRNG